MATNVKNVRLTEREIQRLNRLEAYFPEARSEAARIRLAFLYGLILMEAKVLAAGVQPNSDASAEETRALARAHLASIVSWLFGEAPTPAPTPPSQHTRSMPSFSHLDLDAGADLEDLGGGAI